MSIGNLDAATLAATHPIDYYFSEGSSRTVYLIDGVIYKVQSTFMLDNEIETENSEAMGCLLPDGFAIPQMTLYRTDTINVLACEYIEGVISGDCVNNYLGLKCDCAPHECFEPHDLIELGWCDPTYGNAIWEPISGITYLVDVA